MPNKNKKTRFWKNRLSITRTITSGFLRNKKAMSVVVSTLVLTAGVLALGIAVLYWAYSMGRITSLEYSRTVTSSSHAVSERIGFEYISYSASDRTIIFNIINWGRANNVTINRVHIWDSYYNPVGTGAYTPSTLRYINGGPIPTNSLNFGEEASFTITLQDRLEAGFYNIRVVTGRGRTFDSSFIVP